MQGHMNYHSIKRLDPHAISPVLFIIQSSHLIQLPGKYQAYNISYPNNTTKLPKYLKEDLILTAFSAAATVSYSTRACNYIQK